MTVKPDLIDVTDTSALLVTIGAVMELLPAVSALFAIAWMGIRIYESNTVQRLLGRKGHDGETPSE